MQYSEKDANGVSTGITDVADDLTPDFHEKAGITTFSQQIEKKGFTAFGIGPVTWIELITNLTDTFSLGAAPHYAMQYSEKDANGVSTGITDVADDLTPDFHEKAVITTFSQQPTNTPFSAFTTRSVTWLQPLPTS